MPRPSRVERPGGFWHIAAQGVDKGFIFREAHDRTSFLAMLHRRLVTYEWRCHAYRLMGTHFHLIVQTIGPSLSRGMHALCGSYAQWFNKRHDRKGHLFGRRFLAVAIESDRHLRAAHRYVALNPERAGLCKRASTWRGGSYRGILDLDAPEAFVDVGGVLELYDDRPAVARELFRRFVEEPTPGELAEVYKLAEIDGA